jgi:hypothetical protein
VLKMCEQDALPWAVPIRITLHVNFLLSVCRTVQRSEWDYADLIKHQYAWKDRNGGETVLTT